VRPGLVRSYGALLRAPPPVGAVLILRYCAAHDLTGRVPTEGVARPVVDPDYTATVGLDRDQARSLVAAADADTGPRRCVPQRWCGCCCTMPCAWMRPVPPTWPI
jgi:hypothetical protein